MAQSVERPTVDLSSGPDLRVVSSSLALERGAYLKEFTACFNINVLKKELLEFYNIQSLLNLLPVFCIFYTILFSGFNTRISESLIL